MRSQISPIWVSSANRPSSMLPSTSAMTGFGLRTIDCIRVEHAAMVVS